MHPELGEWYKEAVAELNGLVISGETTDWIIERSSIQIEYSTDPMSWSEFASVWRAPISSIRSHGFLRFQTKVTLAPLEGSLSEQPPVVQQEMLYSAVAGDLAKVVCDLLLAANIAKPGALHTDGGVLFVNGQRPSAVGIPRLYTDLLYMAVERSKDLGWPHLAPMDVRQAWAWVCKIEGIQSGIPKGRSGRAFAALSYLLSGTGTLDLIWALLGLEALYGKGITGLREQLSEKSAVLLGKPHQHKKEFNKAYDYRSRWVHGDLDIPVSYTPHDGLDEFLSFQNETTHSTTVSIAVLLATLQKMISLDTWELNFAYKLL